MRVLVIGGTGTFGSRLVTGLRRAGGFEVLAAGRTGGDVRLDRADVTAQALRDTGAVAVVDSAGPFQGGDLRLARTAIAAGLHYLDLADGRGFVAAFPSLDPAARAAGVTALTGASSTPALSTPCWTT